MSLGGWSSDFSYGYFRRILNAVRSTFQIHLISDAPRILQRDSKIPKLLLRHDIDLDLDRALKMAYIENEFDISSTYMVMLNAPGYRLDDPSSRSILRRLVTMGHEVGLHFDFDNEDERKRMPEMGSILPKLFLACKRLEDIVGLPVRSISFHRPLPQFLRGRLMVDGRVNAYAKELMGWYLSDSKGNWREGEPLPKLLTPDKPLLQLLIHPIWWGDQHMSPEDRLQAFFDVATQGRSCDYERTLDEALASHLGIRRSGLMESQGG